MNGHRCPRCGQYADHTHRCPQPAHITSHIAQKTAHTLAQHTNRTPVNVRTASPDADFILENEEFDLPWEAHTAPISAFEPNVIPATISDAARQLSPPAELPDCAAEHERFNLVRQFYADHGGPDHALAVSPILAFERPDGTLHLLDGWHRLVVAALEWNSDHVHVVTAPEPDED